MIFWVYTEQLAGLMDQKMEREIFLRTTVSHQTSLSVNRPAGR